MERHKLVGLLEGRGSRQLGGRTRLSATKYVKTEVFDQLEVHEQKFLRSYAAGAAAHRSVLTGFSAARIHGMWVIPNDNELVELTNPRGTPPNRACWPDGVQYRHMKVPEKDIRTVGGSVGDRVQVTSPVRTAIDIARLHGVRAGVVAMDSLFSGRNAQERAQLHASIKTMLEQMAGKRGMKQARRAYALSSEQSESPFESLFRVILIENGIQVQQQMWIGDARVDLLAGWLVIEIDGAIKLEKDPKRAALLQLQRENWLRELFFEVARFTPGQILNEEEECVRIVRQLMEVAERKGPPKVTPTPRRTSPLSWKRARRAA